MKGESVTYRAKLALWRYWFNFAFGGMLLLGLIPMLIVSFTDATLPNAGMMRSYLLVDGLIALLLVGWPFLRRYTTELAITDRRVIAKQGVFTTSSIEI